jgi:hypothetical protein
MRVPLTILIFTLNVFLAISEEDTTATSIDPLLCNVACFNIYNPICAGMEMENGVIDYQFFGNKCSLKRKNLCENKSKQNNINLIKLTSTINGHFSDYVEVDDSNCPEYVDEFSPIEYVEEE